MCSRDSVCLKNVGPQKCSMLPKSQDTPATCVICGGAHTANFSSCPKNPRNVPPPKGRESNKEPCNPDVFNLLYAYPWGFAKDHLGVRETRLVMTETRNHKGLK
ncbi:hypothetical protein AVEN_97222-1 [Araneus ventricosus]|uniref:Uncharacterized protein n=1 Tax=Araneus ventricosus TaxID=182803 RepID=A0A4Y2GAL3_ARAVE|nr:hypothetical protein AVEN_97222-1 [Araneus ventricosus]